MKIAGIGTVIIVMVSWSCNKIVKNENSWDWEGVHLCHNSDLE